MQANDGYLIGFDKFNQKINNMEEIVKRIN